LIYKEIISEIKIKKPPEGGFKEIFLITKN